MQTTKARGSPKESPKKNIAARPARQLKINSIEHNSPSPSNHAAARAPKGSPKLIDRRSPRSPISELKRPSKLSELESQISELRGDLRKVNDQLIASESLKKEAEADAGELRRQLEDVSLKLEESQKQVCELTASKEGSVVELHSNSQQKSQQLESQIESVDSAALASALDEIQRLKLQIETANEARGNHGNSTHNELHSLKEKLAESVSFVESMKHELKNSRDSETQAQKLVQETLLQLEAAKETVNTLRSDINSSTEAYNSIVSQLERSRARVTLLEALVSKLNVNLLNSDCDKSLDPKNQGILEVNQLELELQSMKSDVGDLKSALAAAEIRYNEERCNSSMEIRNASEILEQMKAQSSLREVELESELKKARSHIEQLKANLMDKETQLQGISEENESFLNVRQEVEKELKELRECVGDMKANLLDKEIELQNIIEENEMLKQEMKKREMEKNIVDSEEVAASRAAEENAMKKLGYMMEEVDKSNRKAARIAEQLEATQVAHAEMEAELRRLKVQSDQWRKAAEAAASMLSPRTIGSNNKYVEDDFDEDSFKKKNGNVLQKIGVLWKKPQK